jgi:hypothetical protein
MCRPARRPEPLPGRASRFGAGGIVSNPIIAAGAESLQKCGAFAREYLYPK